MKQCRKCNQFKNLDDFHKNHLKKDGKCGYCKVCESIRRHIRYKNPNPKIRKEICEEGYKQCTKCGLILALDQFFLNKASKLGLEYSCRKCHSTYKLTSQYNITEKDYMELAQKQNYVCAGCNRPCSRSLCVDHCHLTLKVRGLLCRKCNLILGNAEDNILTLQNLINYLKESSRVAI